jgi:hypothetical protein
MRYDYEGKTFSAFDDDGRGYLLAPVYRYRDRIAGRTFAPGDCVGLLTEDGRWVRRDSRGRYAIMGTATASEVALTSGAEGAV